jgi:probable 2-oxoglutarate dehydrogenase E1 component DHKTD1
MLGLSRCFRRLFSRAQSHRQAQTNPLTHPNPIDDPFYGPIGVEFEHTQSEVKEWLYTQYEAAYGLPLSPAERINTLRLLLMAEKFEQFLHLKKATYKRYSGEGLESLVPAVHSMMAVHARNPHAAVVTSVGHRGKLALSASLLKFPVRDLFWKISGHSNLPEDGYFLDDIATHLASTATLAELNHLRVSQTHNPSHLEVQGPVGTGKTRAKIDDGTDALHIWVHGDAALSAQGVVYETLQLSDLPDFSVGGTLHIVANNQIGFTTEGSEGRSSRYCTDIFKVVETPILHVNAYCPEAVVKAARFAAEYRSHFGRDFAIDLIGFRKYGHNEVDDPTITNPRMYQHVKKLEGVGSAYARRLLSEGVVSQNLLDNLLRKIDTHLVAEFDEAGASKPTWKEFTSVETKGSSAFTGKWSGFGVARGEQPVTGYDLEKLSQIAELSVSTPADFVLHSVIKRVFVEGRRTQMKEGQINWATAEALAFGSLLEQGYNVRISGQDVTRGTFAQRHAGIYCQTSGKKTTPLASLGPGRLAVVNSPLSEVGVVGFEFGYSWENPKNLVIWEAQFGDFGNCAQTVFDQYVINSEAKWLRQSGFVILLPHGQEGMGPEHSSGRVERFLQQVNDPLHEPTNITVAWPVFPASYFHLLRRQMLRSYRTPLVIMSPKSGLRHKLAVSRLEDISQGTSFKPVVKTDLNGGSQSAVILCCGKVYLDICQAFADSSVTVVALEQLAPFPKREVLEVLEAFPGSHVIFAQEEPRNSGALSYVAPILASLTTKTLHFLSRPGCAAAATGHVGYFHQESEDLMQRLKGIIQATK